VKTSNTSVNHNLKQADGILPPLASQDFLYHQIQLTRAWQKFLIYHLAA
jgi:hypothetical protein